MSEEKVYGPGLAKGPCLVTDNDGESFHSYGVTVRANLCGKDAGTVGIYCGHRVDRLTPYQALQVADAIKIMTEKVLAALSATK